MKVQIDSSEFAGVITAYEFEGKWHSRHNPTSRLTKAGIYLHNEVEEGNDNRVYLHYEREAHAFSLQDIAKFYKVERVLIGKVGKTRVLCLVAKNPKKGK